MARAMSRGKQQVLFNYLPGKTFDFEKIGIVARVESIFGYKRTDINEEFVLAGIREDAGAWEEGARPGLNDSKLRSIDSFVFLDPQSVESAMYPLVFWCQSPACGHVFQRDKNSVPSSTVCPSCRNGRVIQMPFVLIHNCGALAPWTPPQCPGCHSDRHMALERRGERVANFRWFCQHCKRTVTPLSRSCPQCRWVDREKGILPHMSIEVHRAGRTFYPRSVVVLNQPGPGMNRLLATEGWQYAAAAKYLELPEMRDTDLSDWAESATVVVAQPESSAADVTNDEMDNLLRLLTSGEIDGAEMQRRIESLRADRQESRSRVSPARLASTLREVTGLGEDVWMRAGREMIETVSPALSSQFQSVKASDPSNPVAGLSKALGIGEVAVVTDFPVTTAVYGYSRCDSQPGICRLLPFPPDTQFGGALPVFTDVVEADAIIMKLDHERVCQWLQRLGFEPILSTARTEELQRRAYFISLFDRLSLRETISGGNPQARLVFGALHTLSHVALRQAALLCGLDRNSLSEYILPRSLTICMFCNHRFGATIGALVSLFEQSLGDWLESVYDSHHCLYDPVCSDHGGTCHACTHLAETSCRFFNLNLGRPFLFGGKDSLLGDLEAGIFDVR